MNKKKESAFFDKTFYSGKSEPKKIADDEFARGFHEFSLHNNSAASNCNTVTNGYGEQPATQRWKEEVENYFIINLIKKIQKNIRNYLSKQRKRLMGLNNENANFSFISSSNNFSSVKPNKNNKDHILATANNFPLLKEEKVDNALTHSYNPQIMINNYYNLNSTVNLKNVFVSSNLKSHDFENEKQQSRRYGSKFRSEGSQYRTQPNLNYKIEESELLF